MRQIIAGRSCDVISVGMTLADTVPDAMAYLNGMVQSYPSAANIARYAELVRDRALRRAGLDRGGVRADSPLHNNHAAKVAEAPSTFAPARAATLCGIRLAQFPSTACVSPPRTSDARSRCCRCLSRSRR